MFSDTEIGVNINEYCSGSFCMAFDLSPDLCNGGGLLKFLFYHRFVFFLLTKAFKFDESYFSSSRLLWIFD